MKILIEERDKTQEYRIVSMDQLLSMVKDKGDRYEIYVPNVCGGETRVTIFKKGKEGKIPRLRDTINWCIKHQAQVKFIKVYGQPRVEVRAGGYNPIERDTLEQCVTEIEKYRQLTKTYGK